MSDISFATKDSAVVLADALARYKATTGVTLHPGDPRRLHLQALLLEVAQQRTLVDFAGKQNLLRYVSDAYIDGLAELLEETRLPAKASTCTQRFTASVSGLYTIEAGKRVTDGKNTWRVKTTTTGSVSATHVDAVVECTAAGSASNGVAIGQIATLVDDIPGIASTSNLSETTGGRDLEGLEAFRTRLRSAAEDSSPCGPGGAYRKNALAASSAVAGVVVLGPEDGASMDGAAPAAGEVLVLITEGVRDDAGVLTSVIPDPSPELITTVEEALSADTVRPLTDHVTVQAPTFVDFDVSLTYTISRERADFVTSIQAAIAAAFEAYAIWQQTPGRDINPSELTARLINAGAKRLTIVLPAFASLLRDQCSRLGYQTLTYGGLEDD